MIRNGEYTEVTGTVLLPNLHVIIEKFDEPVYRGLNIEEPDTPDRHTRISAVFEDGSTEETRSFTLGFVKNHDPTEI